MRYLWVLCFSGMLAAGCSMGSAANNETSPSGSPVITALECAQVVAAMNNHIACIPVPPDALLLQLPEQTQATLRAEGIQLTFDSTIYWSAVPGGQMRVAPIDGVSVVSAGGVTRIVYPGQQVMVALQDDALKGSAPPSVPQPYDYAVVSQAPIQALPRAVTLPLVAAPENNPTSAPVAPSVISTDTPSPVTAAPGDCVPREDWTFSYTIQPGDTLTRIAAFHNITVAELQESNCLDNPNRIRPGETLRVPVDRSGTP